MNKHVWTASLFAAGLGLIGCDRGANVEKEVQDLQQAEQKSPEVANDLNQQLEKAKSDVVRLEEKLALAKQGVTDEVVEERNEVKEALKRQEQQVREEVNEAQGVAREHNADSTKALQQLEKTQPAQRVEAEVRTETRTVPTGSQVEVRTEQQQVPVQNTRVIEQTNTRRTVEQPSDSPARTREGAPELP